MTRRPISPQENAANISNSNPDTSGTNIQYDQNQGNRGWQLNPTTPTAAELKAADDHITQLKAIQARVTRNSSDELDDGDVYGATGAD